MKKLKKCFPLVLSFVLAISNVVFINQSIAAVGGSISGWNVATQVASGIGQKITATKDIVLNGVTKTMTGTANITPKIGDVGRFMGKVGAAAIVTEAMNQILNGVDYVMDPANNTVTYKKQSSSNDDVQPWHQYCWTTDGYGCRTQTAVVKYVLSYNMPGWIYHSHICPPGDNVYCVAIVSHPDAPTREFSVRVFKKANPAYDPNAVDEDKPITVPLSDVASQVITQAEKDIKAGNSASPAVALSRAVAQDMIQDAETDEVKARPIATELDKTSAIPTDQTAEGTITQPVTDPTTGETTKPGSISIEFPVACSYVPTICQAADVIIQAPAAIKDYLKEDGIPEKDKTDINLPDTPITPKTVNVNWGGSCPAPTTTNISFGGQSQEITILRYDFICEWAWVIKTSVIALASIGAVFIIAGRKS